MKAWKGSRHIFVDERQLLDHKEPTLWESK